MVALESLAFRSVILHLLNGAAGDRDRHHAMKESVGKTTSAIHPLDAMAMAPSHHKVLFENELVRVLDTEVLPQEETPVHAHEWPASLYILSWSDFVRCDADGRVLVDSREASAPQVGSAMWIAPLPPHSVRNVGSSPLRIIAVELKKT
jgi:hypothetical protein